MAARTSKQVRMAAYTPYLDPTSVIPAERRIFFELIRIQDHDPEYNVFMYSRFLYVIGGFMGSSLK